MAIVTSSRADPGRYLLRGRLPTRHPSGRHGGTSACRARARRAPTCATSPSRRGSAVVSCRRPSVVSAACRRTNCTHSRARSRSTPTCSSESGFEGELVRAGSVEDRIDNVVGHDPDAWDDFPESVDDLPPALPVNLPNPERRRDFNTRNRVERSWREVRNEMGDALTSSARLISAGSGDDVRRLIERLERDLTQLKSRRGVPAQPGRSRTAARPRALQREHDAAPGRGAVGIRRAVARSVSPRRRPPPRPATPSPAGRSPPGCRW